MSGDPINSLLQELCQGNDQAAEQVFVTYEPYLRMVVRRMLPANLRSQFDSIDVVHSIWADLLDGFRNAGWRFTDAAHLRAFLVKATRNRFLDRVRTTRKFVANERSLEVTDADHALAHEDDRPSRVAQAGELWERLLASCSDEQRPILQLRRDGFTIDEIAQKTGYHPSSVRRILYDLAERVAFRDQGTETTDQ